MEEKKSGKVSVILTVVLLAIFIPVIIVNAILIVKSYTESEHLPDIFGMKPVIVLSGSMSPVFEAKSLIFVKETDASELKTGDIICYLTGESAVTHRIVQVVEDEGGISFITKGDANNDTDRLAVSPEQVEGVYVTKIDGLGGFAMFMQSTTGMILFIALPIVLYLAVDILVQHVEGKKEKERAKQLEAELAMLKSKQS